MALDNNKTVSLKDLRGTFYECRNFELTNLLQRSIFLTTFICFIAAGYGSLFFGYYSGELSKLSLEQYHIFSIVICFFGISFAVIWMLMSKGGKYWFDAIESVICEIENEENLEIPEKYIMGEYLKNGKNQRWENCVLLASHARYSLTRLNHAIGLVQFAIWLILLFSHFISLLKLKDVKIVISVCEYIYTYFYIFSLIVIMAFLFLLVFVFPKLYLTQQKCKNCNKKIPDNEEYCSEIYKRKFEERNKS